MTAVQGSEIVGTILPRKGPARVELLVDDLRVDAVDLPASVGDEPGRFRFATKDIWRFCGPDNRVTVRIADEALVMPDGSRWYSPAAAGPEPLSTLRERLAGGEIINSLGVLAQPKYLDTEWQQSVLDLHQRLREAVRDITGYDSFLIYGSLLGAVREGRPLGHDIDLDTAYLSGHTDPSRVTAEAGELALALQERGFGVEARLTCIHVFDATRTQRIDLYHLYFNEDGELRLAWGAANPVPFTRSQWEGTQEITFAGAQVLIPRNAEALVETLYGPGWRVPNPGFSWDAERSVRATEAYFPAPLRPVINWQDYWLRTRFDSASPFASAVSKLDLGPGAVVDLGCGDGRDVPTFVRNGSRVVALDRAPAAISSARARHLDPDVAEFRIADLARPGVIDDAVDALGDATAPLMFYGRQLLDSVPAGVQDSLLAQIAAVARPRDLIALEHRETRDDTLTPHERYSCGRRVVDPASAREWMAASGWEVLFDRTSTRWEKRGSKPLHLHRIVGRKAN